VNTPSYKTVSAKAGDVKKEWFIVDAENQILGRLASKIAKIIRGKNKPYFTPHIDCGDNVIVINAEKVRLTGKKMSEKQYVRYTGYHGGQRFATPREHLAKDPSFIVRNAVKGMLPKSKLGSALNRNVFVYAGSAHPHEAQQPKVLDLKTIR
jgi:large subunit ribosomal protein L13